MAEAGVWQTSQQAAAPKRSRPFGTHVPPPHPRAGHEKVLKQCSCVGSSLIYTSDTDRVISQQQSHHHRRMLHHVSGYLVVALLTSIARSSPCSAWKTLKQHNCSFAMLLDQAQRARNLTTLLGRAV